MYTVHRTPCTIHRTLHDKRALFSLLPPTLHKQQQQQQLLLLLLLINTTAPSRHLVAAMFCLQICACAEGGVQSNKLILNAFNIYILTRVLPMTVNAFDCQHTCLLTSVPVNTYDCQRI